ncbi:hypothetical protein AN963_10280 [Brevibacillus choshinensis]|uniref:Uncharacterized protein n=1 Tax=Brevibacillus choshinensis TaxID=54911 RepID=A0ABR5NER9_BRECH|nr:hypothetical protein [Brevibacillus choshinensis]KQL50030.1 hypothetical protein AN963_10280 [Brevibacillus choshinensis]
MNNMIQLSRVYQLALECGVLRKKDIINWCDRVIESRDTFPYEIIEVSLMASSETDSIIDKLTQIGYGINYDDRYLVKLVLSIIQYKNQCCNLTLEEGIRCTEKLIVQTKLWDEYDFRSLYLLGDDYDLAKDCVMYSMQEITEKFSEEMAAFRQFSSDLMMIHQEVLGVEWTMKTLI